LKIVENRDDQRPPGAGGSVVGIPATKVTTN
jgi:hypothetical protein